MNFWDVRGGSQGGCAVQGRACDCSPSKRSWTRWLRKKGNSYKVPAALRMWFSIAPVEYCAVLSSAGEKPEALQLGFYSANCALQHRQRALRSFSFVSLVTHRLPCFLHYVDLVGYFLLGTVSVVAPCLCLFRKKHLVSLSVAVKCSHAHLHFHHPQAGCRCTVRTTILL